MTYGRDGWNARLDIYEDDYQASVDDMELPALLDRFPVSDYEDIWARIMPYVEDVEGLTEIVNNLENSKPDLDKWLPGYKDFWAWVGNSENGTKKLMK
jgi:multiple sugar transport system substrate-binding protein